MKKTLILAFIFLSNVSFAQLDYLNVKDTVCPNICGFRDSTTLSEIYYKLLHLDTSQFSQGLAVYYADLSAVQYELCLRNKTDKTLLSLSLASAEKSLVHHPNDIGMLWNVGFFYKTLGNCEMALIYLKKYGEVCPKKYWKENKDQIQLFLDHCPNDELKIKFKIK